MSTLAQTLHTSFDLVHPYFLSLVGIVGKLVYFSPVSMLQSWVRGEFVRVRVRACACARVLTVGFSPGVVPTNFTTSSSFTLISFLLA